MCDQATILGKSWVSVAETTAKLRTNAARSWRSSHD